MYNCFFFLILSTHPRTQSMSDCNEKKSHNIHTELTFEYKDLTLLLNLDRSQSLTAAGMLFIQSVHSSLLC